MLLLCHTLFIFDLDWIESVFAMLRWLLLLLLLYSTIAIRRWYVCARVFSACELCVSTASIQFSIHSFIEFSIRSFSACVRMCVSERARCVKSTMFVYDSLSFSPSMYSTFIFVVEILFGPLCWFDIRLLYFLLLLFLLIIWKKKRFFVVCTYRVLFMYTFCGLCYVLRYYVWISNSNWKRTNLHYLPRFIHMYSDEAFIVAIILIETYINIFISSRLLSIQHVELFLSVFLSSR